MPEPLYNDHCRNASLREIVAYKRIPCTECCHCQGAGSKKNKSRYLAKRQSFGINHCKGPKKIKKQRHCQVKCCDKGKSCSTRIEQMAQPLNRRIEMTLQRFCGVLDTERVIRVCKLIHDLQQPQPKPPNLMLKKKKKKRCLRAKACCKSKKLKAQWLEEQTSRSADRFIKYLTFLRRMIPNYKQLQVTMMLYKALNFRKLKACNKFVKEELKVVCQKIAILIDVKLQPYKQEFVVDQISCTTLENKHCIFEMFEYQPAESETEIIYEEEASTVEESLFAVGEEPWLSEVSEEELMAVVTEEESYIEEEIPEIKEEIPIIEEEEAEESYGSQVEGVLTEEEIEEEYVEEEQIHFEAYIEEEMEAEEYESVFEEEIYEMEEELFEEEIEAEAEVKIIYEEEESVMLAISEEESMLDYHEDGTSSYVDWCLYVSWLKELGRNIEMYAGCLQQFRSTLQADGASKFTETIKFILNNWSNYLGDSRRVDNNMTQYFKDKPMTWCTHCRDCTIDDYPEDHYIPPELEEVITTTKHWRRLLAEAEEYCNLLGKKAEGEEGVEIEEIYEIFDVATSSSSSYDIEEIGAKSHK